MKLKKYEAATEREAIEKVKNDLGTDALIINIKRIQPRGLKALFKKPSVEITAAFDENADYIYTKSGDKKEVNKQPEEAEQKGKVGEMVIKDIKIIEQTETIKHLQDKLESTEEILQNIVSELKVNSKNIKTFGGRYENVMVQGFFDTLVSQGVKEDIAEKILEDISNVDNSENIDISLIVKIVYNTILDVIGQPETININNKDEQKAKVVMFIGPTGVGKTTTVAKLSSNFIINDNLSVGLLTCDTYRIAAIEQLKTYAEILDIEVKVVYDNLELIDNIVFMEKDNDVILIDTAGRSHKNKDNLDDLKELLEYALESERYLVLSLTTKYEDLMEIINIYSKITDFKIIFTKADETSNLGNILNVCYSTGKKISYLTTGQSVPDDIEVINPQKIAKAILGLGGDS